MVLEKIGTKCLGKLELIQFHPMHLSDFRRGMMIVLIIDLKVACTRRDINDEQFVLGGEYVLSTVYLSSANERILALTIFHVEYIAL